MTTNREWLYSLEPSELSAWFDADCSETESVNKLTAERDAAYAKNRALKQHIANMQEGRNGWHTKAEKLQAKVTELTAERDTLQGALDIAVQNESKLEAERDELLENPLHDNPYVGLVRGKQWERKESSDYYCGKCGWKVTDHDSYCPECGGALHRAPNQPTSQSDAPKSAETAENGATKSEMRDFDDSREKLEADAERYIEHAADYAYEDVLWADETFTLYDAIIELLDRQAAITAEETSNAWEENRDATQREIAELTAERDKLQEQLRIGWECECRLQAERDNLAADLMRANNERERYREKFGKCIDYADAIHALMDDEGMA